AGVHGFVTRDDIPPDELRRAGREQLAPYDVSLRDEHVLAVRRVAGGFEAETASGRTEGRMILIASGMRDRIPKLEGLEAIYAKSAHQCPFCDGWEERDGALAAYGSGDEGAIAALGLLTWSKDIIYFTGGQAPPSAEKAAVLAKKRIRIVCDPIARLANEDGRLTHVVLEGGQAIARSALFLHHGQVPATTFAVDLGCDAEPEKGFVKCDAHGRTNAKGVYVAGDLSGGAELAIVAAGEGARAAHAIVCDLREERT
ncbi:MAG: pyridine nucleotide-disulfide oxidoreductase,class, partial [Myxococcaceae bacterium]|nr:pyridine nucleotide-disulfide oxidoreductase,class [Myxococcaceae bacterium]